MYSGEMYLALIVLFVLTNLHHSMMQATCGVTFGNHMKKSYGNQSNILTGGGDSSDSNSGGSSNSNSNTNSDNNCNSNTDSSSYSGNYSYSNCDTGSGGTGGIDGFSSSSSSSSSSGGRNDGGGGDGGGASRGSSDGSGSSGSNTSKVSLVERNSSIKEGNKNTHKSYSMFSNKMIIQTGSNNHVDKSENIKIDNSNIDIDISSNNLNKELVASFVKGINSAENDKNTINNNLNNDINDELNHNIINKTNDLCSSSLNLREYMTTTTSNGSLASARISASINGANDKDFNNADTQLPAESRTVASQYLHPIISLTDINNFRLEYNKYKILSHLGITSRLDQLNPEVDDDLRREVSSLKFLAQREDRDDREDRNHRLKRSLNCDQVKSNKDACCLETFYVNFTIIGWDKWILYPAGYNANYCRGHCDLSHGRFYHSTLLSRYNNFINLCCSPKKMAALKLLYIDEESRVHQKSVPDMIVESCDCA